MEVLKYKIAIFSEDPDALMAFYRDVLKFEYDRKVDVVDDYGYFFNLGSNLELFVGKHSDISGRNPQPVRHIFDLQVKSVDEEYDKIKDFPGITIVAPPFEAPCSRVATFADPEGNCWQFSEPMECES